MVERGPGGQGGSRGGAGFAPTSPSGADAVAGTVEPLGEEVHGGQPERLGDRFLEVR